MLRKATALLAAILIGTGLAIAGVAAYMVIDPQASAREHALQQHLGEQWATGKAAAASRPAAQPQGS
jgi:uncharacterized membrane protein YadS